jgi:uncharacterized membrane protein (UPF0127 family)
MAECAHFGPRKKPGMTRWTTQILFTWTLFALASIALGAEKLPLTRLQIGQHAIVAETAATEATRALGLMHRKQPLAENRGMLFVFDRPGFHAMWMQNTYIPLSVAFIDDAGVILNIADMTPLTTDAHTAAGFARYALEMNQGWFRARGIKAGAKIDGLPGIAPGKQ